MSLTITGVRETHICAVQIGHATTEQMSLKQVGPGKVMATFRIPEDAPAGDELPVIVNAAGTKSRTGVTVAIR